MVDQLEQLVDKSSRELKDATSQFNLRLESQRNEYELQLANLRDKVKALELANQQAVHVRQDG